MRILSHRGWWSAPEEKNSEAAFTRSFAAGFGTETDVRDYAGTLVISHDIPSGGEMTLDEFLGLLGGYALPLALNIKADGLAEHVAAAIRRSSISDTFVFDMSVPDTRAYLAAGLDVYFRLSEVETANPWFPKGSGVWLDSFDSTWFDRDVVGGLLDEYSNVCVVSSELHGRPYADLWEMLRPLSQRDGLLLCTDEPGAARSYFQGNND